MNECMISFNVLADHCNCTESSRVPTEKAGDYEKEMLCVLEPQLLDCARTSIHNMHSSATPTHLSNRAPPAGTISGHASSQTHCVDGIPGHVDWLWALLPPQSRTKMAPSWLSDLLYDAFFVADSVAANLFYDLK